MERVTAVVQTSQKQLRQLATQIVLQHVPKESGMITVLHLHALAIHVPARIIIILVHLLDWDTVIQVHTKQVPMQLTVQESVQDVLHMAHRQQPIAGLQQRLQHVLLLEPKHVLTVAKPRVLQHLVITIQQNQQHLHI